MLVAVSITETPLRPPTYKVVWSGLSATAFGEPTTLMLVVAPVPRSITDTVLLPALAT